MADESCVPDKPIKIALTSDLHAGISTNTYKIHEEFFDELNSEVWDVLVLAGDLGTCKHDHFRGLLRHVRKKIDRPIVAVNGNHDLWDKETYKWDHSFTLRRLLERNAQEFKDFNIHHLDKDFFYKDIGFVGWDGWYGSIDPMTNDEVWMPKWVEGTDMHSWMRHKSFRDFEKVIDRAEAMRPLVRKIVAVTHMPIFPFPGNISELHAGSITWIHGLEGKCDVLCYGHSHRGLDEVVAGIRVINSGSDYDKPKYKIFEV